MRFLFLFAALIVGSQAVSFFDLVHEQWASYKSAHSKTYESETEEKFRMKIFMENSHKIAKHNQLYDAGQVGFKLAVNKWADMLHHEFIHIVNGFNRTAQRANGLLGLSRTLQFEGANYITPANVELPASVDWRNKGAVTEIKDQGHCGSCWSFSATGALEGQHFRQTGKLISLSEQNLIDCSGRYGNNGCNGGLMDYAFQYVKENRGIDTENTYPYEAEDDRCRYNPKNSGATDKGFVDIKQGSEDDLKAAIATIGPISVAIDASRESFQFYSEGIYYDAECSSEQLDHGVLAVGYGSENGKDYYIVKNSWGTTWGDKGYIKMARNQQNHCGIATQSSYPLV